MKAAKLLVAVALIGISIFTPFDLEEGRGKNIKSEVHKLLAQSTDPFVPPVDGGVPETSEGAGTRAFISKCKINPIVCEDKSNLG